MVFWTDFCIISDYRNLFNNKFKDFEQAKNCFDPAKTQRSSEESLKEKRHNFIGICSLFTWFNMQKLNLCHR